MYSCHKPWEYKVIEAYVPHRAAYHLTEQERQDIDIQRAHIPNLLGAEGWELVNTQVGIRKGQVIESFWFKRIKRDK